MNDLHPIFGQILKSHGAPMSPHKAAEEAAVKDFLAALDADAPESPEAKATREAGVTGSEPGRSDGFHTEAMSQWLTDRANGDRL